MELQEGVRGTAACGSFHYHLQIAIENWGLDISTTSSRHIPRSKVRTLNTKLAFLGCGALPQYGYEQPSRFKANTIPVKALPINNLQSHNSLVIGRQPLTESLSNFGLQAPIELTNAYKGGDKYLPPASTTLAPIIHKQFYLISAPEDPDPQGAKRHLVLGRPQKNYRVVFIKAPSSGAENIKYSAEFAPQEEKTVIYVLSKKENELSANDISTPPPIPASKPEVFFIKYKTEQEAQQAQKEIQDEYDRLGGTSEVSEQGTAPITSVIDGWQAFRDSNRLQYWEYKKALVHLQVIYGIFPYYKVTVENRFNKPHDYIITLSEGDIGLPDKYFYNIDQDDEIVRGYKLLLRDFAINMGIVSREAELFADEIFHYEKRIVNHIDSVKSSNPAGERRLNQIRTLAEMKTLAPSLPIFETLQALFPHTKINEDTEVLVHDIEVFHELSTVLSTSDKKPINNFIIWSLARHLLPHLSKEYRNLVENFDYTVYGRTANHPRWMICTKVVKEWLPFAVDALQQNKEMRTVREVF
uniref:DUF243 domain-containing protein n=1 Tax=Glossina pallidipes TaxID=7398 RepID=A0A1A9ZIE6_GLOPL